MKKAIATAWLALGLALPLSAEADNLFVLPVLRVNFGGSLLLDPVIESHFALDVHGGALIGWPHLDPMSGNWSGRSVWLRPEVGYSLRLQDGANTHLFLLGMGVGYGSFDCAAFAYTPRFVVGQTGDVGTLGFRHGISGHFLINLLSLELSHQVLSTMGVLSHELLFTVGLNPGGLLYFLFVVPRD